MSRWSVVYKSSGYKSGNLLFPQRLSREFLEEQRKTMGSYFFANQYENEVIPDDEKRFKQEWFRPFYNVPENTYQFAFIDPAIGQKDKHDFTAIVVISTDFFGNWYVRVANRYRLTPTQIVDKMFEIQTQFKCMAIGVEGVAYQEALIYLAHEEMRRRKITLPLKDIKRSGISKHTRILKLVPRFEWSTIYLNNGLLDLEDELSTFPRGKFNDLCDALASLEELVFYPIKEEKKLEKPTSPSDPNYERWIIQQLKEGNGGTDAFGSISDSFG